MKVLIIGATGTIGRSVVDELKDRHELIIAGSKSGDITVDINDVQSIIKMYEALPSLDAVVVTAGAVHFAPLTSMTSELYQIGLNSKLLGQVNIVLQGLKYLNEQGSFTLTSGSANRDPYKQGSGPAMVNGAIDGFVRSAAIELPKCLRINAVSPSILTESMQDFADYFRGFIPVSAKEVAVAYSKSVEGAQTGKIYSVGELFLE